MVDATTWVERVSWALMATTGLIGLLANLLVLVTIRVDRSLHTVANLCVQSLCLVDLLYSCLGLPVMIFIYHGDTVDAGLVDDTLFNPLWCVPNFLFSCSLHHVGLLTLDR